MFKQLITLLVLVLATNVNATWPAGIAKGLSLGKLQSVGTSGRVIKQTNTWARPVIAEIDIYGGQAGGSYEPDGAFADYQCGAHMRYSRIIANGEPVAHYIGNGGNSFVAGTYFPIFTGYQTGSRLSFGGSRSGVFGEGGDGGNHCGGSAQASGVAIYTGSEYKLVAGIGGTSGACTRTGSCHLTGTCQSSAFDEFTSISTVPVATTSFGNGATVTSISEFKAGGGGSAVSFNAVKNTPGKSMYLNDYLGNLENTVYAPSPMRCERKVLGSFGAITMTMYEVSCTLTCGVNSFCSFDRTTFETQCVTCPSDSNVFIGSSSHLNTCICNAVGAVYNSVSNLCE